MMSDKDWMTLEEYHKLKDKPVTKKERETHRKWNEQTRPKLERAMDSAIKEENNNE
jgi:hypothetical protein